ncbi:MAG: response regulator [Candidatus Muiribacteriota bacterium]
MGEIEFVIMMENNTGKKKILILDDEKDVTDFIHILLSLENYEVKALNDSVNLMNELEKNIYDLLIIDIMMPQLNGWQLLRLIKNHKKLKNLPVIVITALSDKKNSFFAKHVGVEGFFVKPFSPDELLKKIESILGNDK